MNGQRNIFFNQETIEQLFPFSFSLNKDLKIIQGGKSILKLHPNIINSNFRDEFSFKRPFSVENTFESISEFINQIFILSSRKVPELLMRGQIIIQHDNLMFIGSPWLTSTEDFEKLNLNIVDFALHDGVTDMLQILNTKELITKDIIQLNENLQNQKTVLKKSEEDLKNSNNRLSILIKSIKSAILLENEERKIVLANEEFCKLFKIPVPPDTLIGADCSNAAEESKTFFKNPEQFVKRINEILKDKKHIQSEELEMTNGIYLERDFIPIYSDGEYHGHLWIYKNISERKQNEIELISAKEKAISAKKAKEQFMANMSHELRTPLNIITGIVGLVKEDNLTSSQQEYLNIIKTSSENLLSLVNDILDFEKIEAKKIVFNLEPINLKSFINECVESLKFQATNKRLELITNSESHIPNCILGDPLRLKQILLNLLSNAIKFTDKGFVMINVKSIPVHRKLAEIEIQVKDTGIGIDEDGLKNIFKRYSQARTGKTNIYEGTGLGLTIVKNLVESQNGKISVESILNKGTTFTVRIPFEIYFEEQIDHTLQKQKANNLASKQILVVEDNALNQMIISKMLSKNKANVDVAENGLIAFEKASQYNYDLILMDLQMPVMDGIEATQKIRKLSDKNKSQTPIIALTANILNEEKEKCFMAGMNGYLNKPITEEALLNHIHVTVSNKKSHVNLEYLKSIDPDDHDFHKNIIKEFLSSCPTLVNQLGESIKQKQLKEIKTLTHKLKGMFGYIGSDNLKSICAEIETETEGKMDINFIYEKYSEITKAFPYLVVELEHEIR